LRRPKFNRLKRREREKEEEEEVTLNLNRALKEAQEKRKALETKEKERKKMAHATDNAPKKPTRKMKSEVIKLTGKELQNEIDREGQALNDANRDSNLREMAVKITKMGPEVHAAYVKDMKGSTSREAYAGGSSAGNTPGVKKIPLLRDASKEIKESAVEVPKDPRVRREESTRVAQIFAEVHYDPADVESDEDAEEKEFRRAEAERIQINLPGEAYAVPYADVADIIIPILLGNDDESGCGSDDDIMINIDAEAEELAREEEEEAAGQARIKEISRELEESSVQAGLLSLPPIASILPSHGKGRVVGNTTAGTPGGTPGARFIHAWRHICARRIFHACEHGCAGHPGYLSRCTCA